MKGLSSLLLLVLLGSMSTSRMVSARTIQVIPSTNTNVLYKGEMEVEPYDNIFIQSDYPLSSLRYNDNQYMMGGAPVSPQDMIVVLTSDCTAEELEASGSMPEITWNQDKQWLDISMPDDSYDSTNNFTTTTDIDDTSFLETSTYKVNWTYESHWCNQFNDFDNPTDPSQISKTSENAAFDTQEKEPIPHLISSSAKTTRHPTTLTTLLLFAFFCLFQTAAAATHENTRGRLLVVLIAAIAVLMVQGATNNTTTAANETLTTTTTPEEEEEEEEALVCKINVEILHDGCRPHPLQVQAPVVRIANVALHDQGRFVEECTTYFSANLTIPKAAILPQEDKDKTNNANTTVNSNEYTELPQVDPEQCYRAVEGRPFVDESGTQLQASPVVLDSIGHNSEWCQVQPPQAQAQLDHQTADTHKKQQQDQQRRQALGEEWTRRALGEHASVASFAAFAIALQTHGAPPSILQDALQAAADEVRHAQASFEAASMFLGRPVEPGPLPASSHSFQTNLTALGLATAREGCTDETLSALLAALEVDELLVLESTADFVSPQEREWLHTTVSSIALDESRHAALAWRTIQWICQQDSMACDAVQSTVLNPLHLQASLVQRLQGRPFSLDQAQAVWEPIYTTLIPVVTGRGNGMLPSQDEEDEELTLSWTELVSYKIIQGVLVSTESFLMDKAASSVIL